LRPSLRQYRKDKASANHFFREPGPDFVVGIDFGTTFTTVAFVKPKVNRNEIITIENFSADPEPSRVGRQVPTECWYPLTPRSPFEEDTREEEIESYIENVPRMTEFDESIFQSTIDCPADDKNPICEGYLHGYEVAPYLNLLSAPGKGDQDGVHLTWMKLMLDRTDHTKDIRSELDQKLDLLKRVNRIRTNSDVIRDFFIVTIRHTIRELERHHGFTSESEGMIAFCGQNSETDILNSLVEVVISVPVCWAATSNFIMSKAVNEAMWRTGFGVSTDSASLNLFIVNEAEAAATSCLRAQQHNLRVRVLSSRNSDRAYVHFLAK
jgi:hypothetical protein